MTPERAAAPGDAEGGHDPVGNRSPVSVVADATSIVEALERIAEQLERQNETLTQISRSVDEVPQINTNVEDLDVMFDRFLTFYEDFTERVLPVMLQRAWR